MLIFVNLVEKKVKGEFYNHWINFKMKNCCILWFLWNYSLGGRTASGTYTVDSKKTDTSSGLIRIQLNHRNLYFWRTRFDYPEPKGYRRTQLPSSALNSKAWIQIDKKRIRLHHLSNNNWFKYGLKPNL